MADGLLTTPSGVLDSTGVPCANFASANTRVKTSTGTVAIASDILTFPGPSTVGNWIVPNNRVLVNAIPSIGQRCMGQAIIPGTPPVPGPTTIVMTDTRASGS
jgi:hypothetical protein